MLVIRRRMLIGLETLGMVYQAARFTTLTVVE
jgi:hypothetical protein